jgi:hypothetical protein
MQLHPVELDLDAIDGVVRNRAVLGEQAQLGKPPLALYEHVQRFAPGCLLAVIDFTQVEHPTLRDFASS